MSQSMESNAAAERDDAGIAGLPSTGNPDLDEARARWLRANEWESAWRPLFVNDIKFRHGDSDNGFQWPNSIRRSRDVSARPCLTMNLIRQHNLQIANSAKKNKVQVQIVGKGKGASADSAEMIQAIVSDIQYKSDAQQAYGLARAFQVDGGCGYWRLATDWAGPDSFDQIIKILPIEDPLMVFLDPDVRMVDGSDAKWGFVYDRVPKGQFREAYPKFAGVSGASPLGAINDATDWADKDHVIVCEYFRKKLVADRLMSFVDPADGQRKALRESAMPDGMWRRLAADSSARWRDVWDTQVDWMLWVGETKIDETVWPGTSIPIIRCLGEETIINGVLDRKGHTRAMKDAQRMLNYNASGQVEFVALQSKTPWTGAAAAIEDHESLWNTANNENHAFLPFNHLDDNGDPLPPQALPQRVQPPTASPAYETGMSTAFNQMMMVSGQWQNTMGMAGAERTGAAIDKRIDQGDTATFHFEDNFQTSIVFTGKQIVELIPKIYDTERVLQLQASDGSPLELLINPAMKQSALVERDAQAQVVKRVLNPMVGEYEVQAIPVAATGTKREQTVEALTLILTQAPALTGVLGDLLMSAMDFPGAQEAAQRLRRMVPPQALGQGPSQSEQALQQQVHQLQLALAQAMQKLGKEQLKLTGKEELRDIEVYNAETARFKALADALMLDQGGIKTVVEQLVRDAAMTHLDPVLEANAKDLSVGEPDGDESQESKTPAGTAATPDATAARDPRAGVPGARQAPDGEWYLADPTRRGKYLRIAPLAQERGANNIVSNR